MSFIDQMAAINIRQGKTPIDPTRIEGFGPGNAPPPAQGILETTIPTAEEQYGAPIDVPSFVEEPPTSPLLELAALPPGTPVTLLTPPPVSYVSERSELWVQNLEAGYKDRGVILLPAERDLISKVVLKAIRRDLDAQYQALTGTRPRSRGSSSASASPDPTTTTRRRKKRASPAEPPTAS